MNLLTIIITALLFCSIPFLIKRLLTWIFKAKNQKTSCDCKSPDIGVDQDGGFYCKQCCKDLFDKL